MNREELHAEALRISEAAWSSAPAQTEEAVVPPEPYYDGAADAALRADFYAGFRLPEDPRRAFEALHVLLSEPHQGSKYDDAKKKLHSWIDIHPNGRLRSIYSNREVDPKVLLAAEEEIARLAAEAGGQPPYNCEHVVPASWFREREPMHGDLHHLFTCETRCNQYRAHHPYFDFAKDHPKPGCGEKDQVNDRFEPLEGKGPVARATLYFLVRHPGHARGKYDADRIAMLKRWHHASRVDPWEQRRNFTIHQAQKNRNPFIDEPEWVDLVDFDR